MRAAGRESKKEREGGREKVIQGKENEEQRGQR
jgi:hypothetical protein